MEITTCYLHYDLVLSDDLKFNTLKSSVTVTDKSWSSDFDHAHLNMRVGVPRIGDVDVR